MDTHSNDDLIWRLRVITIATVIVSIWLFLSPFVLDYNNDQTTLTWAAIGTSWVAPFIAALRVTGGRDSGWLGWAQTLVGLFMIAAPWIVGETGNLVAVINAVICGAIIAGLAMWGALSTPTLISHTPEG